MSDEIEVRLLPMATTIESKTAEPLDTSVRLVTPERVEFRYPLAGPFRRSIAYLIDLVVLIAPDPRSGRIVSLLLTLGSPSGLRPDPGDRLRADLGLRSVLRGDLQRPDRGQAGGRDPGDDDRRECRSPGPRR